MSEHTPGPWSFMDTSSWSLEQRSNGPSSVCHVGDFTIVTDDPSYEFHGTDEADARLIAAAPELLATCKLALDAFEKRHAIDWDVLEAAIAKATRARTVHARAEP
jgi:hypothetical protein